MVLKRGSRQSQVRPNTAVRKVVLRRLEGLRVKADSMPKNTLGNCGRARQAVNTLMKTNNPNSARVARVAKFCQGQSHVCLQDLVSRVFKPGISPSPSAVTFWKKA